MFALHEKVLCPGMVVEIAVLYGFTYTEEFILLWYKFTDDVRFSIVNS